MAKDGFDLEYKIGRTESETARNLAAELKKIGVKPNMTEVRKLAKQAHRDAAK